MYDVFGKCTVVTSAGTDGSWITPGDGTTDTKSAYGNPYMFTGRRYDDETGLYYYRARYYKPNIGRFLQSDPIGYDDGMNMYTYVGNNPASFVDPWGLAPGDLYPTEKTAATQALMDIRDNTTRNTLEYGGFVYRKWVWFKTYYSYTKPITGKPTSVDIGKPIRNAVGAYHSHPYVPGYAGERFSGATGDKGYADRYKINIYSVTPSGRMKKYSPVTGKDIEMYNVRLKQELNGKEGCRNYE